MASEITYAEVKFKNESKSEPPAALKEKTSPHQGNPGFPKKLLVSLLILLLLLAISFLIAFIIFFQRYSLLLKEKKKTIEVSSFDKVTCEKTYSMVKGKGWVCCPENWFASNTSCYLIPSGSNTWTESQKTCSEMGAHLLVVNTMEEQNFIIKKLEISSAYYVGLSDPEGKHQWQWVDGSPYNKSATFWHRGEPSNQDEQCVMMNSPRGSWGWNDCRCDSPQRSICEMKKISF